MLRPESSRALTVAFGMGSAFRAALIAGLKTDAVELVPSVPKMFGYFYPDADGGPRRPERPRHRHRRPQPRGADRPRPTTSSSPTRRRRSRAPARRSSRRSSTTRPATARLNPGGVMMQWTPYGSTVDEFQAHLRTFHAVFPHVLIAFGPGGYGFFMFGSDEPMAFDDEAIDGRPRPARASWRRSRRPTTRRETTVDGWREPDPQPRLDPDDEVAQFTGDGPLITDDRPLPEYFLLRRLFGPPSPRVTPGELLQADREDRPSRDRGADARRRAVEWLAAPIAAEPVAARSQRPARPPVPDQRRHPVRRAAAHPLDPGERHRTSASSATSC